MYSQLHYEKAKELRRDFERRQGQPRIENGGKRMVWLHGRNAPEITVTLAFVGVIAVVVALVAAISASAGRATHPCSFSPKRSGGISEMAPCGTMGLRGNRKQFVAAITRPVANQYFLARLPH